MVERVRITETKRGNGVKRDPAGRFLLGTAPGPGRPAGVLEPRTALIGAVTPEDTVKVMRVILREALKGRAWACSLFLDRILGRMPVSSEAVDETPDPDESFL